MKVRRIWAGLLMAAIAAGVFLPPMPAFAAHVLITADEAKLPPPKGAVAADRRGITRGPKVEFLAVAEPIHSPMHLQLKFESFGGAKIDPDNLDKSVDSIFKMIDYGHQSIADMVPVAMFIDGISIWLAYYIWSVCPTAGGQESSIGISRGFHDRLTPHVEAGVDQHRATGPPLECSKQASEQRVANVVDRLHPGRAVDVGDSRNRRPLVRPDRPNDRR